MPTLFHSNDNPEMNHESTNPGAGSNSDVSSLSNPKEPEEEPLLLGIIPADVQRYAVDTFVRVQGFCVDTQETFVLDRQAMTTAIFLVLASVVVGCMCVLLGAGGLAAVTCPLWIPVALLTSPLWIPLTLLSSPVWMTAGVTVLVGGACGGSAVLLVLFFFTWPEEWLPHRTHCAPVHVYLRHRDAATVWLAKLQAKFWLYAAGVGPAADAVFVVLDKVDVSALATKLQTVDWPALGQQLQKMELHQVQETLIDIISSLIPQS